MAVKQQLQRKHLIQNRRAEITIGLLLFILGCYLLYDAYDARGKRLPWPASGLAPW
jgi:hypothetical protein